MGCNASEFYTDKGTGDTIMKKNIKILYNNSWISSDKIKSVNVIEEIDITFMTAPTTAVDIVLECEQDDDLEFDLLQRCDIYDGNTPLFELYVSNSARASRFEWKLSLFGELGRVGNIKYYGDIYSDPNDYIGKPYAKSADQTIFDEQYSYTPTISTPLGILQDISEKSNAQIECSETTFPSAAELLHKVRIPVCDCRSAIVYTNFLIGGYITDGNASIKINKFKNEFKNIPERQILNDAKLSKKSVPNIKIYSYQYDALRYGGVAYRHYLNDSVSQYTYTSELYCNIIATGLTGKHDPVQYVIPGHDATLKTKKEDEFEIIYDEPVSTIDMYVKPDGWGATSGKPPLNPNYSPVNESITYERAAKYLLTKVETRLELNENSNQWSSLENELLSPTALESIKERVKSDFSYDGVATLNIVEGYDKVKYGQFKFGAVKYGYNEQQTYEIGDKVKANIRGKEIEGYITRMKYNLNGSIIVKNCEIAYKRSETNEQILD